MLNAVLVIDDSGFPLFEYYPDKKLANSIIKNLDNMERGEGIIQDRDFQYYFNPFSDKFTLCLVYEDEELSNSVLINASDLGKKIMQGDKVILRQVLAATTLNAFEGLY